MTSAISANLDPEKNGIRTGEISLLMATRGRPEMLAEQMLSLRDNTVQKDKVRLWVYVDDDDEITRKAIDGGNFPILAFPFTGTSAPRPGALGQCHQALWNVSGRVSEIYMITCDDVRFATPGWDKLVRDTFASYRDGVLLGYAPRSDGGFGHLSVHRLGLFENARYEKIFPGIFVFWFDDKWIEQIARMAGRCVKIPVTMSPIGDKGKTQRMRCVPFWTRFAQLTIVERKDSALKLVDAMYPPATPEHAAALAGLEKAHAFMMKEENNAFNDLYCIFQEERHTALKPEDRNRFSPLYLKQESVAVIRLLTHAQAFINKSDYAEAMKFLEAVDMADMKVRAAHDMKIQCLRALNRNAEADVLAAEKLAAWPEQDALRRIFRFFGMVANEGRRLLAGQLAKKPSAPVAPPVRK